MGRFSDGKQPGDKLGPKLVDLAVQATLATRRGLADHEAKVRTIATQGLIDRAGREVADLYAPLLSDFLERESVPLLLREHVGKAASGRHQWQALAGFAWGASGAPNAISTILSNEIAPLVYTAVGDNPHLLPDIGTLATLACRGLIGDGLAHSAAASQGYGGDWIEQMAAAAATIPALSDLLDMHNRGLLSDFNLAFWLIRAGLPADLADQAIGLGRLLLTPADAALAVLRGELEQGSGAEIAGQSGMNATDFGVLVANSGEPLGLEQLLEAFRRGFIDQARLERGIRQSRVRDEWTDVAIDLRFTPVPTADAIDAWQRGRIGQAEAVTIAEQNGVEPSQVAILLANAGNPPGPEQLLELWRRGFIDADVLDRGLMQGRLRDEWIPATRNLAFGPMSSADAVDAWQRGHITEARALQVLEENGVEARDRPAILANAGNPLALEQLLEAFRRGFISQERMEQGIREGRLRDDWIPTAVQLRYSPMSTADAVQASVQNYLTRDQAKAIAEQNGLAPADFNALWEAAGEPLARTELQQLYDRKVIGLDVYLQALRESRLKDKYIHAAVQLHTRLPEPRIVTEALEDGVIDAGQAADYLASDGYSPETIDMLIRLGAVRSTGPYRQLMTGEVASLYADHIISEADALAHLEKLHYQPATAALILTLAEHQRDQKIRQSAITGIRAHFLAFRINALNATADLLALGLPPDAAGLYVRSWGIERIAKVKELTPAQIVKAVKLNLFVAKGKLTEVKWVEANHDAGRDRLVNLGYSAGDAELLLAGA